MILRYILLRGIDLQIILRRGNGKAKQEKQMQNQCHNPSPKNILQGCH